MLSSKSLLPRSLAVALCLGATVGLAACGQDPGPSVRAEPDTSTSTSTTSTTSADSSTTSTTTAPVTTVPAGGQSVAYRGLRFTVPASWPVHDLAADPSTCVRLDAHAVFVGPPGPEPRCPAHLVGHTETVSLLPLRDPEQVETARATVATTINGIAVRVDPDPDSNGALTVVFPTQKVLAILSYGDNRATVDAILASVALVS